MDKDNEQLRKMQTLFREIADLMDELIALDKNSSQEQIEAVTGRYMIKMMQLQAMSDEM